MPVDFIFNNFWILLILGSVYNAFLLKLRSRKFIQKQPELREGYDRLFIGELIYLNIPWVIAGVGIILGGVPGLFSYLTSGSGNLFILAFQLSIGVLCVLIGWWVFFKGGAEFLAKHPGALGPAIQSPALIRVLIGLLVAFGIFAIVSIWLSQ